MSFVDIFFNKFKKGDAKVPRSRLTLKKGLKGKTFLCLIEMDRAAKGTPERAVRLILAEEVVGSVAL